MVAIDENEKPVEVPDIIIDTEKKRAQLENAEYLRKTLR